MDHLGTLNRCRTLNVVRLDEDTLKWKKSLKNRVEEDIRHKVLLRLKLDAQPTRKHKRNTSDSLLHHPSIAGSRPKHRGENPTTQHQNHNITTNVLESRKDTVNEFESKDVSSYKHKSNCLRSVTTKLYQEVPRKNDHYQIELATEAAATHQHNSTGINLPAIFEYVHVKYGVPQSQLQYLCKTQHYKCKEVNVSGLGTGPIIRCPVESRICLPSPIHEGINPTKPILSDGQQLVPSQTPSLEQQIKDGKFTSTSTGKLSFESKFESGNLQKTSKLSVREYKIWMTPDLYSTRHTQWFYFQVTGMVAEEPYTFHVVNFQKPDSLHNYGMQPLLYSEKDAKLTSSGWKRVGHTISYRKTSTKGHYTLTWTMVFPHAEDTCYLAYCYPYTFSRLMTYIGKTKANSQKAKFLICQTLCHTLAGNPCPMITITNFEGPAGSDERKGIVVTARVHPGETNSSWMMEGLIEFLLSDCPHAKMLRNCYIFKLVPMLNPDGVIVGNYRTSLAGVDLNRVYKNPHNSLFPTIYHTKKLIQEFMKERELLLYIDLHGHSRKHNVFMYGCHTPRSNHHTVLEERVIPYLLSQQAPCTFDYHSCKFAVERCKEATGRVVMWKMGIFNSFTLEATFCGSSLAKAKKQFSKEDLTEIGTDLAEVIYSYHLYLNHDSYRSTTMSQIAEEIMKACNLPHLALNPKEISALCPEQNIQSSMEKQSLVLNRFTEVELATLEHESSTTGSDSENDTFSWTGKKKAKKKKAIQFIAESPYLPQLKASTKRTHKSTLRQECKTSRCAQVSNSGAPVMPPLCEQQHLKHKLPPPPQKYHFINKYQDRSSGGMPIFSEERLKERRDKRLLKCQDTTFLPTDSMQEIAPLSVSNRHFLQKLKDEMYGMTSFIPLLTDTKTVSVWKPASNISTTRKKDHRTIIEHLKLSPHLEKYIRDIWKT